MSRQSSSLFGQGGQGQSQGRAGSFPQQSILTCQDQVSTIYKSSSNLSYVSSDCLGVPIPGTTTSFKLQQHPITLSKLQSPDWFSGTISLSTVFVDGFFVHGNMDPALAKAIARLEMEWGWPSSALGMREPAPVILEHAIYSVANAGQKKYWKLKKKPKKSFDAYMAGMKEKYGWTGYNGKGLDIGLWARETCRHDAGFKAWLGASKTFHLDKMGKYVTTKDFAHPARKDIIKYEPYSLADQAEVRTRIYGRELANESRRSFDRVRGGMTKREPSAAVEEDEQDTIQELPARSAFGDLPPLPRKFAQGPALGSERAFRIKQRSS